VTVTGGAEGGLLVAPRSDGFWASTGLGRGEAFARWPRVPSTIEWASNHIHVRLRSDHSDVSCSYSADGQTWHPFANSTCVNGIRYACLYAAGEGEVVFPNFTYRGLE
jgi:hypothetical protein